MPPGNQTSGRTELGSGYCLPMGLSQGSPRKPACQPFPSSSLTQPPLLSVPVPPTPRTHLSGLAVLVSDLPLLSALIPLTLPFAIPTHSPSVLLPVIYPPELFPLSFLPGPVSPPPFAHGGCLLFPPLLCQSAFPSSPSHPVVFLVPTPPWPWDRKLREEA